MTVTNQTFTSPLYYGNNITTTFPTAFQFALPEDLRVDVSNLDSTGLTTYVYGSDYTLLGANNPAGGTVVLTVPLPSTKKLRIVRNTPYTQTTDYVEGTDFPAQTHEKALDRLTYIAQTLQAKLDRAPQLATTSANVPQTFPDGGMTNRGKLIRWDPNTGSVLQAVAPGELTFVGAEIAGEDVNIRDMTELNPPDTLDYTIVYDASADINRKVKLANLPYGGSGAPQGLSYVTVTSETALPNERVLTAGDNISITDGGPGAGVTINAIAAPVTASFLTVSNESGLSNERAFTTTAGFQFIDHGPNTDVLLGINVPTRTEVLADNSVKPMAASRMIYHKSTALGWATFFNVSTPTVTGDGSYNIVSITRVENTVSSLPFTVAFNVTLASVGCASLTASAATLVTPQNDSWYGQSNSSVLADNYVFRVRASNASNVSAVDPGAISCVIFGTAYAD